MKNIGIYYLYRENNFPFYIGKSKNPKTRINSHKKKFGNDIILEVIDYVPNNDWKFWEEWYIQLFKSWGFLLKNKNKGGGGSHSHSFYTKNLISKKLKNRVYKKEWAKNLSKATIDKSKNMPKDFGERISRAKKGIPNPKLRETRKGKPHPKKSWKIEQFDLSYNYIQTFTSAKEAGECLGRHPQSIRDAASGIQKTAYGYKWKYKEHL